MSSIISSLNLNGKSDYEKVQAIYKYLTDNVTYDNTHGSDYRLMFTAYGALIDGTSVCQGYASAFYRLCLYEGIDARILASKDHAWNIVEIGGAYYLLDATWDAYENVQGNWRYFLKGSRYWKTFHDNDNYTLGNLDHWQSKEPVENCYYIPAADYTITKPVITSHPQSVTAANGKNVSFKVSATGSELRYQWQYRSSAGGSWVNSGAPGNKTATLSFAPTYQNGYQYRCIVSNSAGTVYSNAATLTVKITAPKINSHPQSTSVAYGADVTFKVAAFGGNLRYQWQFRSSADGSWVNSAEPESKTASFSFTPVYQNGYQYRCIVSNSAGTVNSDPATLTVNAISGTFNGSPAQVDVTGNLLINDVNFPDANFRSYISDRYYSKSGYMTEACVAATTSIHCNGMRISSLKGIEYFTALTNLYCYNNQLTTLDVSGCTDLSSLVCYNNQLTTLDLSSNSKLSTLICEDQSPTVECSVQDGKYIMNLSKLVGAGNLSKVSSVTGGSYDSATGIVTLDAGNTKVTYNYNTGAPVSPNTMQVIVNGT